MLVNPRTKVRSHSLPVFKLYIDLTVYSAQIKQMEAEPHPLASGKRDSARLLADMIDWSGAGVTLSLFALLGTITIPILTSPLFHHCHLIHLPGNNTYRPCPQFLPALSERGRANGAGGVGEALWDVSE
jgi:hypothetical protein